MCSCLNAYDISPGSFTPKVSTMLDFNLWTFNSRAYPGTDPMVARLGERVRIRVGNLSMTNHPTTCTATNSWWRAPTADGPRRVQGGPKLPPTLQSARCAPSNSPPPRPVTGRFIVTKAITP